MADFFAAHQVGLRLADCFIARIEGLHIVERAHDGSPQQALSHGRLTGIERVKQRDLVILAGLPLKQRFDEFEVADCDLVEFQSRRVLLKLERIDVQCLDLLRCPYIVEHRSGGNRGGWMRGETEAFEGAHVELTLDKRHSKVAGPDPVFYAGAGGNAFELSGKLSARGQQDLAWAGFHDFVDGLLARGWAGELGGAEFTGGDVEEGNGADLFPAEAGFVERGKEIVLLLAERGVERCAWRQDPGYFAADDLFSELGVLHLVADGDAVALAEEAREIGFDSVIGNPAHGLGALAVACGEGELKFAAHRYRVVVEEFVEVAHAEEEQGVRVFALGRGPLAHEGR